MPFHCIFSAKPVFLAPEFSGPAQCDDINGTSAMINLKTDASQHWDAFRVAPACTVLAWSLTDLTGAPLTALVFLNDTHLTVVQEPSQSGED